MLEIILLLIIFIVVLYVPVPPILLFVVAILTIPAIVKAFQNAPFLPMPKSNLKKAFNYLKKHFDLNNKTFVDLGCGDGRVLEIASKHQLQADGFEISLLTFLLAKFKTRKNSTIRIFFKDFWKADFNNYDIIYTFAQKIHISLLLSQP